MELLTIILAAAGLIVGAGVGYVIRHKRVAKTEAQLIAEQERILKDAQHKADTISREAQNEAFRMHQELKKEEQIKREQLEKIEARLVKKEEILDDKIEKHETSRTGLEEKIMSLKSLREEIDRIYRTQSEELQRIAAMNKDEAREVLLQKVEEESKEIIVSHIKKSEEALKKQLSEKSKYIIANAIQRYAAEVTAESTVTIVDLPSDEMKGRIIGREGRNINTFEQITGIDVIIDDTPGSIIISGFDMIRRYIAKVTLEKLIADGRIHPARIEETFLKIKEDVNTMIKDFGEKAVYETGVTGLPLNLVKLLGRLRFRVAFGQNVLKHSTEVSYLSGLLAEELGADVNLAKKGGLLHDIGKAVDHEVPGHHAKIGAEIARKFGLSKEIIHVLESHHGEPEASSLEAMIVSTANIISNSRPGATKDNLDSYIKRMGELEGMCASFKGVKKSYAVQAGSEVRVFVEPEQIDDLEAVKLTHNLAKKIETDFSPPGPVKVNVIRETRAEAFAE
ncbi:ribonuclease Y [Candidatus Peregrinibacteria bacterium]|nr:ribonuclease Y [Candidatus Peregrinibacteria bacterium]